mmetsp:Transcript_59266/g.152550  ORF Transcript_59266/g.152550 Transcript_59266/m.152550 type:complete len:285 (+) Transcript_59266:389-1243(+)
MPARHGSLAPRRERGLRDVRADRRLLRVHAHLSLVRPDNLRARRDAAMPDVWVTNGRVLEDPVVVDSCARVGRGQPGWSLAEVRNAGVRVHEDVEEPIRPVVKLDGNLQVLQLRQLDAPHVLHVCHARGQRGGNVWHANGILDARAATGNPVRHAMDQRHHGARDILRPLLGGLRMDLRERGADERDGCAVLGDAAIHSIMAEKPQVSARLRIHVPLAVDLPVDLGDRTRERVVDRIRCAPEAVRATDDVHSELGWEFRRDALVLGDLLGRANHEAVRGLEEVI